MTCEIVKDLIPMYVDKTASDETAVAVKNHIKICPECRSFYKACKATEEAPKKKKGFLPAIDCAMKTDAAEESYARFSKKLKKKKSINIVITICIFVAMATYVVIDILNTVKRKDRGINQ